MIVPLETDINLAVYTYILSIISSNYLREKKYENSYQTFVRLYLGQQLHFIKALCNIFVTNLF